MNPLVSIIIAVGVPGDYVAECVTHCLALDYDEFEIIVLPDTAWEHPDPRVRVVPTGTVRPAEKRDRGVRESKGGIVAFIDDDAYPATDWLSAAVGYFASPEVAAVGGPAVTPPADGFMQKVSGWVYESPLVSAAYTYRYLPGVKRFVDDYPTSNLIIRKSDFIAAGGFDTGYWPGEDTILCLKLVHDLGKRIAYDPAVLVHHHRRTMFGGHLRQIKSYALHRGLFAKRFPKTSLKPEYFVPTAFTLFALAGWSAGFAGPLFLRMWAAVMALYGLLVFAFSVRSPNPVSAVMTAAGIVATHLVYGAWFALGLLKRDVKDT